MSFFKRFIQIFLPKLRWRKDRVSGDWCAYNKAGNLIAYIRDYVYTSSFFEVSWRDQNHICRTQQICLRDYGGNPSTALKEAKRIAEKNAVYVLEEEENDVKSHLFTLELISSKMSSYS